jgi:tRNA (guanine37-N1)-methyltransferase
MTILSEKRFAEGERNDPSPATASCDDHSERRTPRVWASGWSATVLTLFPDMFPGPLGASLLGKALEKKLWRLEVRDIREHGLGRHRTVDDTPAGGGPGMVMRADVAAAAIDAVERNGRPLIYLSPRGAALSQSRVRDLAAGPGAVLLCGRFEGLDQRVIEARAIEEISIGDFVLAGGEIAAMALIEASVRLLPGVLGDAASCQDESFAHGLLEYPHFTRPQAFEGMSIPEVLTQGNHSEIAKYRLAEAERLTRVRRPDLWTLYEKKKP